MYEVLRATASNKLILFFNGWGMDAAAVQHLHADDYSIVHCNDYSEADLQTTIPEIITQATELYVVAWSLGVWVANNWLLASSLPVTKAIAMCGTLQPIHADWGIAPDVFKGTLDGWNEANRNRFQMRMFKDRSLYAKHQDKLPARSCENQQIELDYFYRSAQDISTVAHQWSTALVADSDLIIPSSSQSAYWNGKVSIKTFAAPHFPFHLFMSWSDLLSAAT